MRSELKLHGALYGMSLLHIFWLILSQEKKPHKSATLAKHIERRVYVKITQASGCTTCNISCMFMLKYLHHI